MPLPLCFSLPVPPPSDAAIIRRCVELARRGAGQTRPNPPVGCILTDANGRPLGQGYHKRAGGPHAEIHALQDAQRNGHSVEGATAYVTLEPCNHYGRTPPCAATLARERIGRVVVGVLDPDPRTAGGGVDTLRKAGVVVDVANEPLCAELVEGFVNRVLHQRPIGLLKWAMTLDGKIASETGSSRWVTGAEARQNVHELRAQMDAIVVGGQTVRSDNPQLTVRGVPRFGDLSPIRVVMSKNLDLPDEAHLWDTTEADTVVFTQRVHGKEDFVQQLKDKGVHVIYEPNLTPDHVMEYLYDRGCLSVLWECGGGLAAQAIKAGAVQKVHSFIAPKIIGGVNAPSPVASPAVSHEMSESLNLSRQKVKTFENGDVLISGYLQTFEDWHSECSL